MALDSALLLPEMTAGSGYDLGHTPAILHSVLRNPIRDGLPRQGSTSTKWPMTDVLTTLEGHG